MNKKRKFLFSLQFLAETFHIPCNFQRDINVHRHSRKLPGTLV